MDDWNSKMPVIYNKEKPNITTTVNFVTFSSLNNIVIKWGYNESLFME